MRTIKFRGKRIDNGEWVYGDYYTDQVDRGGDCAIDIFLIRNDVHEDFEVKESTVGQFTGLKDYIQNDIYEGDKMQNDYWVTGEGGVNGVVKWSERAACWCLDDTPLYFFNGLEITGTIHDS